MNTPTKPGEATQGKPIYKRIVVKLSGESFSGPDAFVIHAETIQNIAREVNQVHDLGVEVIAEGIEQPEQRAQLEAMGFEVKDNRDGTTDYRPRVV